MRNSMLRSTTTASANDNRTGRDAFDGAPLFGVPITGPVAPATTPADDEPTAPTSALAWAMPPVERSDEEKAERHEMLLEVIAKRRSSGEMTPARERFLTFYESYEERLPRAGRTYSPSGVLQTAGVDKDAWWLSPDIRYDADAIALYIDCEESLIDRRGGDQRPSLSQYAKDTIRGMSARGVVVETSRLGQISHAFCAGVLGITTSEFKRNTAVMRLFHRAVADGTLKQGNRHLDIDFVSHIDKRRARKALREALERRAALGDAVDATVARSNKYDFDELFDEAGLTDPRMREFMKTDQLFRQDLWRHRQGLGIKPVHMARLDPDVVTWARLVDEGLPVLVDGYRTGRTAPVGVAPEIVASREKAWADNQRSAIMRLMRTLGRLPDEDATVDLETADFAELRAKAHGDSASGNAEFDRCIARWVAALSTLKSVSRYPASFAGAFDAGMLARGISGPELARRTGLKLSVIHAWRRGGSMPTYQNLHVLDSVERELGMPPGTLRRRTPSVLASRTHATRKTIVLSDGRTIALGTLWRYMDKDAPLWDEDRLRSHVEEVYTRHFGRATASSLRLGAAFTNAYALPEVDPVWPLVAEVDDYIDFLTDFSSDHRVRHPRAGLNSPKSIVVRRRQLLGIGRWMALPIEAGGLGLSAEHVSLRMLLNQRVVQALIAWRVMRAAGLEIDGVPIGPMVTSTEKNLIALITGMLDPDYGWLAQSLDVLGLPEIDQRTFVLPVLTSTRAGVEVAPEERWKTVEVMPASIVEEATANWRLRAGATKIEVFALHGRIAKTFKMVRDPAALLGPLLRHPTPLAAALRTVREALKHVRPRETSPKLHAADVQRALAFLMLLIFVFRSETLREMTWRADGSGQLRKVNGRWEAVVPAIAFKNVASVELFGPSWNRRDYEREIGGDWGGLEGLLDYFLNTCRPILLDGRSMDTLFVPPRTDSWDEHSFNNLIMSFTRKWVVYNARYGTGMKGVKSFGPHAVRNIVATHILRTVPGEERWYLAAMILGTGVARVKMNYGWVDTRHELAKVNAVYDDASRLAAGRADLW